MRLPGLYGTSVTASLRLVALVAVLWAVMVGSDSADAAMFQVRSCVSSDANHWHERSGNTATWRLFGECPRGLGIDTRNAAANGATTAIGVGVGGPELVSANFLVSGESRPDVTYEIVGCQIYACTEVLATLPHRDSAAAPQRVEVPMNAAQFFGIRATCTAPGGCPASGVRGPGFSDFLITAVDDRPPVLNVIVSSGFAESTDALYPYWVRSANAIVDLRASDMGLGMGSISAAIDDQSADRFFDRFHCPFLGPPSFVSLPLTCPQLSDRFNGSLPLHGFADGLHRIKIQATDALNNSVERTLYFLLDNTPPAVPREPVVSGAFRDGWTDGPPLRVSWSNGPEVNFDMQTHLHSGISTGSYDLEPLDGQADPEPVAFYPAGPTKNLSPFLSLPADGRWRLSIRLGDGAGNFSGDQTVRIGRDQDPPPPPVLTVGGWLNRSQLIDGVHQTWEQPGTDANESGVCGYAHSIDAAEDSHLSDQIDVDGERTRLPLPASIPAGLNYFHLRAISCAGRASSVATVPVRVDDAAPVVELHGAPPAGWQSAPVDLRISADDDFSGVASVSHGPSGGAAIVTPGAEADLTLGEGRHLLEYSARDAAGNSSPPLKRAIDIDMSQPTGGFLPANVQDPTDVKARVSDSLSGVDTAQIQYRRTDTPSAAWQGLPTSSAVALDDSRARILTATVPDEQLADGEYALRVVADDVAGNAAILQNGLHTEGPASVAVPLRRRLTLSAGSAVETVGSCRKHVRKRSVKKRSCRSKPVKRTTPGASRRVRYADRTRLMGHLRDSRGAAVADVPLKVYAEVEGAPPKQIGDVVTGPDGAYDFKLNRGPTRRLIVRFGGDRVTLPAEGAAELRVSPAASLRARPDHVKAGRTVRFTGRIEGAEPWLPAGGKIVQFEFRNGRYWQPAMGTVRADRRGRFALNYPFRGVPGRTTTVEVRAWIIDESLWPFEDGASNAVRVTIRP